jgi:hypothetical protein
MNYEEFFYQCSPLYLDTIDAHLRMGLLDVIERLPKRETQHQVNQDLLWLLSSEGWAFDTLPASFPDSPPYDLGLAKLTRYELKQNNDRQLCRTSVTLDAGWMVDFAKQFGHNRVCIEVQFGKVESMFKDFCGFRISRYEKHLALGIEIVMSDPGSYFRHRKQAVSGMAYYRVAKETLPVIGLDCPIWLIGIK